MEMPSWTYRYGQPLMLYKYQIIRALPRCPTRKEKRPGRLGPTVYIIGNL